MLRNMHCLTSSLACCTTLLIPVAGMIEFSHKFKFSLGQDQPGKDFT